MDENKGSKFFIQTKRKKNIQDLLADLKKIHIKKNIHHPLRKKYLADQEKDLIQEIDLNLEKKKKYQDQDVIQKIENKGK